MIALVVILALIVALIVYCVGIYNGLVSLRENIKVAWANIDVLLKQRHDELPKLVETCKRYMQFEQETLEKVMRARASVSSASTAGNVAAVGAAEQQLRAGVGRLFAVAENYPQLKTDETFKQLQGRIIALEESIADRRELYNDQVNLNNIRVKVFPDVVIAQKFGFMPAQLLEFAEMKSATWTWARCSALSARRSKHPSGHVRQSDSNFGSWCLGLGWPPCTRSAMPSRRGQKPPHRGHSDLARALRRAGLCRTQRHRRAAAEDRRRAPLTGLPCTWWRYKIEQRRYRGRSRSWCDRSERHLRHALRSE